MDRNFFGNSVKDETVPVSRIVRRRARAGREKDYETVVKGMLDAASHFPGYLASTVIPPHTAADRGEYQIVQRFATEEDLNRWDASKERGMWHERLHPVTESAPAYHSVAGLEILFSPKLMPASTQPQRWKMTTVSWLGIFPTVTVCLGLIAPRLQAWPFLVRTAIVTALVAILMSYVIMPRLSRWMNWWLRQ